MKKVYKIILALKLILVISGCASVKEGFSSQKKNSSDEFFVEKKAPLVMPPNYGELPIPNDNQIEENNKEDIKKLISKDQNKDSKTQDMSESSRSLEKNILDKIKN